MCSFIIYHPQIHPSARNTVIGYMAFLATRPHVPDIGPVGTVPPQNNFALEAFYTMKKHTPATGHRMLADVRNIVSHLIKVGVGFFLVVSWYSVPYQIHTSEFWRHNLLRLAFL